MSLRTATMASGLAATMWLAAGLACAREPLVAQEGALGDLVRSELNANKTGKVQTPHDPDERSSSAIAPPVQFEHQRLQETPATTPAPPPTPVATRVPNDVQPLDGTVAARVNELRDCRREIATNRRVSPSAVDAGRLLLRWTIQPGGEVADSEVVAEKATDPDVLSCVRRMMSGWIFVRAPGGSPLHIEQQLTF